VIKIFCLRILLIFLILANSAGAQTLGGNTVYNFLKLPAIPLLTAAGGINISYNSKEIGFAMNNPALLEADLHGQLNISFNNFLAGIKGYALSGGYHHDQLNTSFGAQLFFLDYGSIPRTDAAGNENGVFRPVDFVAQISGSRKYLESWQYGFSLKFIHSSYEQYRSSGIAVDAGIVYKDSTKNFSASVLVKNMGFQLSSYSGIKDDLPFDLQVGITKRLEKAPFGFSVTAQQVHNFDLNYEDTVFNSNNGFVNKGGFINNLVNHFVLASHIYLGNNLEATLGYNFLRRTELNVGATGNGLNGFSVGLRAKFKKLEFQYARANYQRSIGYNQIGITLRLNQLFGMGEL